MSIVVQCPHCETKFNLQPEMVGKAMRCPNLECRQTFTVKNPGKPVEPPEPLPLPDEPEPPHQQPAAKPAKPRPAAPSKPAVVEAQIVEAAVVAPPKVKEVVWSEGQDVPPPPKPKGKKTTRAAEPDDEDDTPIPRRRKQKNRRPWVLIGMTVAVLVLLGFGTIYIFRHQSKTEDALAKQADEQYEKGDYAPAQKAFRQLATEYPKSDSAPRYEFFAALCALQLDASSAAGGEPEALLGQFKSFAQKHKDSPFAKPSTGRGADIFDAGHKFAKAVVSHAEGKVADFRKDRAGHAADLQKAEKAVATGRELVALVEPFRAPEQAAPDDIRDGLAGVEKQAKREHDRAAAIAGAAKQLQNPSDELIHAIEAELAAVDFLDDEAAALIADAKAKLRAMVNFEPQNVPPAPAPTSASATVLFVTPVGPTRRPPILAGDPAPPTEFLAVARGILYALDEETGTLKWAVRVGADEVHPPAVTRADLSLGPTDLAMVTSNVGGKPALAAYVLKTGEARWYQPLEVPDPADPKRSVPAAAVGPAVVVGGRAYVAVRDREGSIYEFDVASGIRKGRIRLGQPAGPGLAVRPGTGLIYAAADARRVLVIDAGAKDDGGAPVPPRCVQVLMTQHPPGSLRTPPVLIGTEGDAAAEQWMILAQADGKLRAFPVPPPAPPPAEGGAPPETLPDPGKVAEAPIDGWVWFPPATDAERLALVTDRGEFRVFGINQPKNFDKAVFPIPSPGLPAPPDGRAVRGLVLPAEESAFWVLANGGLQKYRVALIPSRGVQVVEAGPRTPVGEPTQAPQFTKRRDSAFLVVRSQNSAGCKAVLLNLGNGELRWQRQLGVIPAATPVRQEGVVMLASEDGGLIAVPATGAAAPGQTTVAPPAWVVGVPPEQATGPTRVALAADGTTLFTVTPVLVTEDGKPVAKYVVRRVAGGRVAHEGVVVAPGAVAGNPVVLGESLLIPASDGFVHRYTEGTGRTNPDGITPGPPWATGGRAAESECFITLLSETSFLTGDGGKKLAAWNWPKSGGYSQGAGRWDLPSPPAGRGLVLPPRAAGESPRLLVVDVTGTVRLYAADRGGEHLRLWRSGGDNHPAGRPSSVPVLQTDAGGKPVVAFTIENRVIVCIDPEKDSPNWVARAGEEAESALVGSPQPAGAGRWLVTDLGGRVGVYDAEGKKGATLDTSLPGAVPAMAAASVGGSGILAALSDGSVVVLSLPAAPAPAPEPKPKG